MYNNDMKIILFLLLTGIIFVPHVFAQTSSLDEIMTHMRFTHSQLSNNIGDVIQLIKSNNTSEALTLLEGMDIKIKHMNTMFNDLVWEMSNKGH
jgi:predicted PurR-regulated permease PerM